MCCYQRKLWLSLPNTTEGPSPYPPENLTSIETLAKFSVCIVVNKCKGECKSVFVYYCVLECVCVCCSLYGHFMVGKLSAHVCSVLSVINTSLVRSTMEGYRVFLQCYYPQVMLSPEHTWIIIIKAQSRASHHTCLLCLGRAPCSLCPPHRRMQSQPTVSHIINTAYALLLHYTGSHLCLATVVNVVRYRRLIQLIRSNVNVRHELLYL